MVLAGIILVLGVVFLVDGLRVTFSETYFERRQNFFRGNTRKTPAEIKYATANRVTIGLSQTASGIFLVPLALILLVGAFS